MWSLKNRNTSIECSEMALFLDINDVVFITILLTTVEKILDADQFVSDPLLTVIKKLLLIVIKYNYDVIYELYISFSS